MYVSDNNEKQKRTYHQSEPRQKYPTLPGSETAEYVIASALEAAQQGISWAGEIYEASDPKNFGYAAPSSSLSKGYDYANRDDRTSRDYYRASRIAKGIATIVQDSRAAGRQAATWGRVGNWWDTLNFADRAEQHPDQAVYKQLALEAERKNWGNYYKHDYGLHPWKKAAFERDQAQRFYLRNWRARKMWYRRNRRTRWRRQSRRWWRRRY